MSIVELVAVVGIWLLAVAGVWLSVWVSRRLILDEALEEVGLDDPARLEQAVRRRLGDAGSDHEVEQVLEPVRHGHRVARA